MRRHKKMLSGAVCLAMLLVVLFALPMTAYADVGPKPSVHLTFAGADVEDKVYYTTLLSEKQSTGPFSADTAAPEEDSYLVAEHTQEALQAWQAFRDYRDADGFFFLNYFQRCNDENTFAWTYYPPDTFKVLVYFPQENRFAVGEIEEKYAFDSYYTVPFTEKDTSLTLVKSYDYAAETVSLAVRILLTLAVELAIALLFGLRKKRVLLFVLGVNVVTQIALNVLLNWFNYADGGFAFVFHYVWMELLVMAAEGFVFSWYFSTRGAAQTAAGRPNGEPLTQNRPNAERQIAKWVAPVYAVVANAASFGAGMLVAMRLPGIF